MSPGPILVWIAFLASLVAGLGFLAATGGREQALRPARWAFRVQWLALAGAIATLWTLLFSHDFRYEYVANYTSRAMEWHYVMAGLWGGQEGTFLLWALITCTLGLALMRVRHALTTPAMFFLNLPLVMLGLVSVMRGPFLMFPGGRFPMDGQGLNPLLQDPWMTIHPPVLFTGFSSLVAPFAIAMAALVRRDYDGWVKVVLPWAVLSTAVLATGFIMGGVWAYKVLGWGGYWGWDPVENGSFIPWLSNVALLHGLLVQRVTGSLRRTNFFLAVTSYVLVLYASFLTRSGVLADFSVHSFVNLGLNGFLLSFLLLTAIVGYGTLLYRLRDIPGPREPLGSFSRESMMWLGQLVFMLMCALTAVGMSAPLITRLFGPPSNVQTTYYNLVNAPLAVALGVLLGLAPLMRWRKQDPQSLLRAALPAIGVAVVVAVIAVAAGVRAPLSAAIVFAAAWGLAANAIVTLRGFRAGWKHGIAYLGHLGVSVMLIGIVASSQYGREVQVQLPQGQERSALGYRMTFEGVRKSANGKDRVMIAVNAPERKFEALPALYWSEFSQGYMKKPHIERLLTHDIYISPLEMVGEDPAARALWLGKGETKQVGQVKYTFVDFDRQMGEVVRVAARLRVEIGGRTVPARPVLEMNMQNGVPNRIPDYLPGGGSVQIVSVDPNTGRVALEVPGMGHREGGDVLAVEVSTKPLINLVWVGAIIMLGSAFLSVLRRALDLNRSTVSA
ncbi:MAG TPA: cytochrome c-type biogenesis CcmF C-terminal domain-containing protein [Candidatus Eisenbacteria bacterium]